MHLGISITPFGQHPAAWLKNGIKNALQFDRLSEQVKRAQDAKLDFIFFSDNFGQRPIDDLSPQTLPFEPTTLVAALATVARDIGLIATAAIDQHEPYNLARRFASLDTISKGRAGWNYVTSTSIAKSAEYIDVVSGLWDSWEDDAFIYHKAEGRFFRPEKMHVLNHKGENFTVRGPLNVNRSAQGKPVVTTLLSAQMLALAAQKADVVMLDVSTRDEAKIALPNLLKALNQYGRDRNDVRVLANIVPYVGTTEAEANRIQLELDEFAAGSDGISGIKLIGTAQIIADRLQEWGDLVDGFTILPPFLPAEGEPFIEHVVPELQNRGVFRQNYTGQTLREHLSLPRPAHPAALNAGQSI